MDKNPPFSHSAIQPLFPQKKVYIFLIHLRNYLNSINLEAEVISEILLKAASEPEFRKRLIKNPNKILECYDISSEAKQIIQKSITDLIQ